MRHRKTEHKKSNYCHYKEKEMSVSALLSNTTIHFGITADLDVQLQYSKDRTVFHVRYYIPERSNINLALNELLASVTTQLPPTPAKVFEQTLELKNLDDDVIDLNAVCSRGGATLSASFPDQDHRDAFAKMIMCLWAFVTLGKTGALGQFSPDLFKDYAWSVYWGRNAVLQIVMPILESFLSSRRQLQEDKDMDDGLFDFAESLYQMLQQSSGDLDAINDMDVDADICEDVRRRLNTITGNIAMRAVQALSANHINDIAQFAHQIKDKVSRAEYETIVNQLNDLAEERRQFQTVRDGIRTQAASQLAQHAAIMDKMQQSFEAMLKQMDERMTTWETNLTSKLNLLDKKYADLMRQKQQVMTMGLLSKKTSDALTSKIVNRMDHD